MEESFKRNFVEQIYQGYESEQKDISRKYGINHKSENLNYAKLKRESNIKEWIDSESEEHFIFLDKRSILFIDVKERILYAYMSDNNRKQIIRRFKQEKELTYLTAIILLRSPSVEEKHDEYGGLFDASIYNTEKYDEETYEKAIEKSKRILEEYGDYIDCVRIVTRDNSIGDTPRINMFELSSDCDLLFKEDWSKYIPVSLANDRDNESLIDKQDRISENRKPKHAKLRKAKRKIE